ncbi:MAG TPA: glycoside hydrolase family 3 C-terminal domain-containing protein [Solirubrobacteraceae bacterium]|nr:glycoside hydrolase family 3 C-terminal domain-containing protein [Solirubrobacteraceae bacterium]
MLGPVRLRSRAWVGDSIPLAHRQRHQIETLISRAITLIVAALSTALLLVVVSPPAVAVARGQCGDPAVRPWCNTTLSPDARAQLVLAAMTAQERISFLGGDDLSGVAGGAHAHTGVQDGVPRLGVPTVNYTDGPLGPRQGQITGMPSPEADAATWSPADNLAYGQVAGAEARSKGNDVIYGPTVNLIRTPLWGRTYEAFGEDPFLVSGTAVAWIKGVQSTGVMADVKHFAENNQEGSSACCANSVKPGSLLAAAVPPPDVQGGRMNVNVSVDERTLREMELAPFEAAVKQARAATIMCSYNLVNGVHSCENDHLLRNVLGQWGFQGYVLSDYLAAHDPGRSLKGGLDFEPWPGFDVYGPVPIGAALLTFQASQADVDRHVFRILRTWFASGVFDRSAFVDDPATIPQAAHARVAQRVEQDAITLLRNRGHVLPLNARKLRSIAVIGAGGNSFVTGGGSGNVTPFRFDSPEAAISARVRRGTKVLIDDGSNPGRAAQAARSAQVAVVLAPDYTTEGVDRACLSFECPTVFGDEDALIGAVAAANRHTVVVLENSGAILTPWRNRVAGLLEAWYPGQEAGPAISHVLFGDSDPGGRLPLTFPATLSQEPTAGNPLRYPGVNNQESYSEGVFLGYRWFDAHKLRPAFPFGFGLSYTQWRLDRPRVRARGVSVRVRNVGRRTGSTVVQLFAGLPSLPGVPQPPRDLRGYRKVTLRAHRSATVHFTFSGRDLAYWNTQAGDWQIARGRYSIYVGFSAQNPRRIGTIRQTHAVTIAP